MADWQELVQSMIIGFVFAYMVMKLFSVISSFRSGNFRVERGSDAEGPLLVPNEIAELASAPLAGTDEELEADGEDEGGDDSPGSSSSDSDAEAEGGAAAAQPREIHAGGETGVDEVASKKEERVDAIGSEEVTRDVSKDDVVASGEESLKALTSDDP